jgi:hypothetical protein
MFQLLHPSFCGLLLIFEVLHSNLDPTDSHQRLLEDLHTVL